IVALVAGLLAGPVSTRPPGQKDPDPKKAAPTKWTIFKNVRLFDGKSDGLKDGMHVAVVENKIQAVSDHEITAPAETVMEVIDCSGKPWVLMPRLIDAHVHATIGMNPYDLLAADNTYVALRGASELEMM